MALRCLSVGMFARQEEAAVAVHLCDLFLSLSCVCSIMNYTNPGAISHNEVLQLYKDYVDPDFTWSNFTLEEQAKVSLMIVRLQGCITRRTSDPVVGSTVSTLSGPNPCIHLRCSPTEFCCLASGRC